MFRTVPSIATDPAATTDPDAPTSDPGAPTTDPFLRSLAELLPPHTVVLHNDEVNVMDHVTRALLVSVPELDLEQAVEVMMAAHEHGEADVISCPLERAELYRQRLEDHGLTATIRR